jgi:phospholipase C
MGKESNPDATGTPVSVSVLAPGTANVYFTPGANPGEGFTATHTQLFGEASPAVGAVEATLKGSHTHRPIIAGTTASDIVSISRRWGADGAPGPAGRLVSRRSE